MAVIALVEDAVDTAELFCIMLENDVDEIRCFGNGPEFLQAFESDAFDLVLLDIALPGMNGFAVLEEVRKRDAKVPVVAVTAHAFPQHREKALNAGFNGFITKPIEDDRVFREQISGFLNT